MVPPAENGAFFITTNVVITPVKGKNNIATWALGNLVSRGDRLLLFPLLCSVSVHEIEQSKTPLVIAFAAAARRYTVQYNNWWWGERFSHQTAAFLFPVRCRDERERERERGEREKRSRQQNVTFVIPI